MVDLSSLKRGIPLDPLPRIPASAASISHAPRRKHGLNTEGKRLAVANALRYFPVALHKLLAPEFAEELEQDGHIHMRRFRPTEYEMQAYPIADYPAKCTQCAAMQAMIMNNLDIKVAQHPHELITYGGNGSVFQNWAQYHLVMKYLSEMSDKQTLAMYSGHPLGIFPSSPDAPRVVITNGMVIPNYSSPADYERMYAQGVSMYGQMTAGSWMYIGPQGIVHGTTLTLLNAGRKYLASADLAGKVYVSSGLGGMSGAQPKAGVVCGSVTVVAEINPSALEKRHAQGWVDEKFSDVDGLIGRVKRARSERRAVSIGFLGNVVDLWERLAQEKELFVELGSDQTSLHNPYNGGYYPAGLTFDESNSMMVEDPALFKAKVQESLVRQVRAINSLTQRGMAFWDYGNAFLLEAGRAGADIFADKAAGKFKYPSYVEDIMGDIFSLGFGPFRWVCMSQKEEDLQKTDEIARECMSGLMETAVKESAEQYGDNVRWIEQAMAQNMVVGSQARILYSDLRGRRAIAVAFNEAVASGKLSGPVVIGRDHHDVSGTDSPFRETSNIRDGSMFCADMAIQNVIGDSFRGATWVSIHNGGGVGWGEVINGGFGLVLDGSAEAGRRAAKMVAWDVGNGLARRAWSGHPYAQAVMDREMALENDLKVTMPAKADPQLLAGLFEDA